MHKKYLTYLLIFVTLVSACGRRSLPKPPEERAPAAVREARIEPQENSLQIFWKAPLETASGDDLLFLRSFELLRREVKKDSSNSFVEIAVIDVPDEEFDQVDNNQKSFRKKTSDAEYQYVDSDIELGSLYEYLIVPRSLDGIEGVPNVSLRISFLGQGSVVETIPFTVEEPEADQQKE